MTEVRRLSGEKKRLVRRVAPGHMPFVPWGLAPAVCLGAIVLFAILPFAHNAVEQVVRRSVQNALDESGADWAALSVSGQWVTLDGAPPSKEAADRALDVVRNAKAQTLLGMVAIPVTRVSSNFGDRDFTAQRPVLITQQTTNKLPTASEPLTTSSLPQWTYQLSNGILNLDGEIANENDKATILEAARDYLDPPRISSINDNLSIADVVSSEALLAVAMRGVTTIGQCDEGVVFFIDGEFSLRCDLPAATAQSVERIARAPMPIGRLGVVDFLPNEAVNICEQSIAELFANANIEFRSGSARIAEDSGPLLDDIAAAVIICPGVLRIEGHTDNTGDKTLNQRLSETRAEAVRTALLERGVNATRLIAEGFGETRPLADNDTSQGRARNRRIEIRVVRSSE